MDFEDRNKGEKAIFIVRILYALCEIVSIDDVAAMEIMYSFYH